MSTIEKVKPFKDAVIHPAVFDDKPASAKSGEILEALSVALAQAIDLRSRTKQAHWSAKGGSFYALHKMFQDFSVELDSVADDIAGRIMALGGSPGWTPASVAKISKLPVYATSKESSIAYLEQLTLSYQAASKQLPGVMAIAAKSDDHATANIISGFAKLLDEQMSFVAAHMPLEWTPPDRKYSVS
jgi:starvation-inducible DNA-binding protein